MTRSGTGHIPGQGRRSATQLPLAQGTSPAAGRATRLSRRALAGWLVLGGLCWVPGPVMASSFYIGAQGGLSVHRDTTFNQGERNETRVTADYRDDGETASVVLGRASPRGESFRGRVELEFGEQSSTVSTMTFDSTNQAESIEDDSDLETGDDITEPDDNVRPEGERFTVTSALGDTTTRFGFVSAYGDFNLWRQVDVILGVGLGVGKVEFSGHSAHGQGQVMEDDGLAVGYHLALGLGWRVASFLDLEASYRHRSFEDVSLQAEDGSSSRVRVPSHNVQLGLRLLF